MSSERNSSFELLRIISIMMIILHHLVKWGGYLELSISGIRIVAEFLVIGGKIGAYCFVLISGYYCCGKSFKSMRIFKIWQATAMYGVVILLATHLMGLYSISVSTLVKTLIPICSQEYWFVTAYVGMLLLSPIWNYLLFKLDKNKLLKIIVLMILIFFAIPTILPNWMPFGNTTLLFSTYYLIGGYLRKYPHGPGKNFLCFFLAVLTIYVIQIATVIISDKINLSSIQDWTSENGSLLILIASVSLFMTFMDLDLFYNKYINIFGKATFGVYLLHDNYIIRSILWNKIVPCKYLATMNPGVFLLCSVGIAICIFISSVIIDTIRCVAIEKHVLSLKCINKICSTVDKHIDILKE